MSFATTECMGFLDNLENSLKSLETREERDRGAHDRRQQARKEALALAPWAQKLKGSAYTQALFQEAATVSHRLRAKIYMAWLDTTLRLETKGVVCELRPTPDGIEASYRKLDDGAQITEKIDLNGRPGELLKNWLGNGVVE